MEHKCSICNTVYEFNYQKGIPLPSHFPFCSDRCKTIDLGKWLNEEYCISTPLPEAEILTDMDRKILAELLGDDTESEEA